MTGTLCVRLSKHIPTFIWHHLHKLNVNSRHMGTENVYPACVLTQL